MDGSALSLEDLARASGPLSAGVSNVRNTFAGEICTALKKRVFSGNSEWLWLLEDHVRIGDEWSCGQRSGEQVRRELHGCSPATRKV